MVFFFFSLFSIESYGKKFVFTISLGHFSNFLSVLHNKTFKFPQKCLCRAQTVQWKRFYPLDRRDEISCSMQDIPTSLDAKRKRGNTNGVSLDARHPHSKMKATNHTPLVEVKEENPSKTRQDETPRTLAGTTTLLF